VTNVRNTQTTPLQQNCLVSDVFFYHTLPGNSAAYSANIVQSMSYLSYCFLAIAKEASIFSQSKLVHPVGGLLQVMPRWNVCSMWIFVSSFASISPRFLHRNDLLCFRWDVKPYFLSRDF